MKYSKRIAVLTGGGDVQPLNSVIHAAKETALKSGIELLGIRNGWQGLLENDYKSLMKSQFDPLIGGTILKSSRINIAKIENGPEVVRKKFAELKLDGLIVIGGEDTLSNAFQLRDLPIVLISKTIDNDVGINNNNGIINYFTLGYPTAAQKIASFVSLNEGLRTTAYSHERIIIVESMGMHAGWLALSSSMGNPDFIIIPEFPLDYEKLVEMTVERYKKNKNVIIVIAEGSRWKNGEYISADPSETDSFGHPKFKGAGEILTKKLKIDLKKFFDTRNVNSVNPSYLYRSGRPNKLDSQTAYSLGVYAVNMINKKKIISPLFLTTKLNKNKFSIQTYPIQDLSNIEDFHRFTDERFYNHDRLFITKKAKDYLSKINSEYVNSKYLF